MKGAGFCLLNRDLLNRGLGVLILNFHGLDFHIHKIKEGELFFYT